MNFNKQQLEAINSIKGNISVIATAGSGKTTVLINRMKNMIENHGCEPSSILAITFSRKAKENILKKLDSSMKNINVETFHSLALKIIISTYGKNSYKVWTAYWEKEKMIQDICVNLQGCNKDDVPVNEILSFISLQKVHMLSPNDNLIFLSNLPYEEDSMRIIYKMYEEEKEKNSYIEFDDFLNIVNKIFDTHPDVLEKYQSIFQYILVDEFQDVSLSQALFLQKLNKTNTMIVGDPLQAIYAFRGGNSKYILNLDKDYSNTKVINLNVNYRCSKEIVNTANKLALCIPDSKHKNYVESVAYHPSYKAPEVRGFEDEYSEATWISEKILNLKKEYGYNNMAVLARTNAQLQKLENILHKSDIAFDIVDGSVFTDLSEIKLILSYLKLALNEDDNESFRYLYNKPNRWLSKKFLEENTENSIQKNLSLYKSMDTIRRRDWRFKNGIDEIYEVIRYLQRNSQRNVSDLVHYLRKRLNIDQFVIKGKPVEDGQYLEQIENLNSFENMCKEYDSIQSLVYFINDFNEKFNKNNTNDQKVKLLTIHKAKGLEYPVVFIIGCNNNLLPHYKNDNIDDEKRLMYVAITRAEKELYISYTDFYNNKYLGVSPFITDIEDTVKTIKENNENQMS